MLSSFELINSEAFTITPMFMLLGIFNLFKISICECANIPLDELESNVLNRFQQT